MDGWPESRGSRTFLSGALGRVDALPTSMGFVLTDVLSSPGVSHVSLELFRAPPLPHAPAPSPKESDDIERWNLLAPYISNAVFMNPFTITNEKRRVCTGRFR